MNPNIKIQNTSSEMVVPKSTETDATLAVSNAAGGVSFAGSDFAASCDYVLLQAQGDSVRVTFDGSAPTTSNGLLLAAGQMAVYNCDLARVMKFIRVTTDAVIWGQPFNCLVR